MASPNTLYKTDEVREPVNQSLIGGMGMEFAEYRPYLSPALAKATDLIVESGRGCYLTDINGDQYLDSVQGIAANALGHCHPKIVASDNAANNYVNVKVDIRIRYS